MIKIGITGSLASGKTTVSKIISRKKYPIYSADIIVKNLYGKKAFQKKLKKKFNLLSNNSLKKDLKSLIKKDSKILDKIEKIVHPIVRIEMKKFLKKKNSKILICEIPLLVENKLTEYFDVTIFVSAKKVVRLRRYLLKRGSKKMFETLDKRQINPKIKKKKCDYTINNDKSLKQLKNLVGKTIARYE
jgi:dephospho-CoA kinase